MLGGQGNVRVLEGGREGVREKDRRGTSWVHKEEEDESKEEKEEGQDMKEKKKPNTVFSLQSILCHSLPPFYHYQTKLATSYYFSTQNACCH